MLEDVGRLLVVTHVGAMERLDDFAVNAARHYPLLVPDLLSFLRSPSGRNDGTALLPELGDVEVGEIVGNLFG